MTRDITNYVVRREFVSNKFSKKEEIQSDSKLSRYLLIIDDIINTGLIISRLAKLFKETYPNISDIQAFCLGMVLPK